MRIKTVTYAMTRTTQRYENDRVEITVELGPRDTEEGAFRAAKEACERALALPKVAEVKRPYGYRNGQYPVDPRDP